MSKSQGKSTLETVEGVERDVQDSTGAGVDANVAAPGEGDGTGTVKVGPRTDLDGPTRGEGGGGGGTKTGSRADEVSPRTRGEDGGTPAQKQGGGLRTDKAVGSDR